MRLKNIGSTGYQGRDYDGAELRADPGQEFEVSEPRAERLFKDFPGRFERVELWVTLDPVAMAEFEVTADPTDTSAAGGDVPVQTVISGTGDASAPVSPAAPTAPDPPPAPTPDQSGRRGRRRRGQRP